MVTSVRPNRPLTAVAAVLLVVLAGCTTFSADGGFGDVQKITGARLAAVPHWPRTEQDRQRLDAEVKQLVASPLTAESAVQLALLNNRALRAIYSDLGIAEADLVQAGRLVNPGFSFSRLKRGADVEIDRVFLVNVLSLITMPMRTEIERRRFELAKVRVAEQVLRVEADTRRAYFAAIASQETARYAEQVREAGEASAELARRMAAAGNFSKLDQAREQVFYAEVTAQLARARQSVVAERERLTRLLGLWGDETSFKLPVRLPDLPKAPKEVADLEQTALAKRLDVQGTLAEAQNIASSLGLTRVTGYLNVLEVGYARNSESGLPRQTGYELELRLPLFDWGGARVARSEAIYMQAVNVAADTAIRARSEVRESYTAYRTAFDLARHYRDEIVPLRKRISDENVLRYSGMLISVFELLADARQQIAAVTAYIDTLRDFWVADTNLDQTLTGSSAGALGLGAAAGQPAAADAGGGH